MSGWKRLAAVAAAVLVVGGVIAAGVTMSDRATIDEAAAPRATATEGEGEGEQQGSTAPTSPPAAQAGDGPAAAVTPQIPAFSVTTVDGRPLSRDDIRLPAVIHFFASWCPNCQAEAADFATMQERHPELNYYYVAVADTPEDARSFISEYGWKPAPLVHDPERELETQFGLSYQPNTVFVGVDGSAQKLLGGTDLDGLERFARRAAAGGDG